MLKPGKDVARKFRKGPSSTDQGAEAGSRRTEILEIAAKHFAIHGYEASTIREIAAEAEILSGSIYHHFATKEDMIDEIIRPPLMQLKNSVDALKDLNPDPELFFTCFMMIYLNHIERNGNSAIIMFNDRRMFSNSERFSYVRSIHVEFATLWREILKRGKQQKIFDKKGDDFITVAFIIRTTNAFAEWFSKDETYYSYIQEHYDLEDIVRAEVKIFLRSLRTDERRNNPIPFAQAKKIVSRLV